MITHEQVEKVLLGFAHTQRDYPFGEGTAVYFYQTESMAKDKMFALIQEASQPLRLSLKCDPQLAQTLRERYESVLPGYHLNKNHWNTIICSGQLSIEELIDLMRHSYELVVSNS